MQSAVRLLLAGLFSCSLNSIWAYIMVSEGA